MPTRPSHKGQNGKLLIVAGSGQYHGAAVLAVLAARRFVDLVYFCPGEADPYLLHAVKQIPEVIVDTSPVRAADADAVLVGNGIHTAPVPMGELVARSRQLIIDGDGLGRLGSRIPPGAILTPHEGEFQMLFRCEGTQTHVQAMAKKHRCVILKKGAVDIISDGTRTILNKTGNAGMTKGGTGDVLAGLTAAWACKNDPFVAAAAAAYVNGYAGDHLRKKFGYHFCASDLAEHLAEAYFKLRKQ